MISRRNYLSILLMITILGGIFLFVMVVQNKNSYDINEFVVEGLPNGKDRWKSESEDAPVLFFGGADKARKNMAEQWCTYTKRAFLQKEAITDYVKEQDGVPSLILLDAEHLSLGKKEEELLALAELGIPMIFVSLPQTGELIASQVLREILGVEVVQEQVTVEGVRLFDGFFMGGAADYVAKTEEEQELQDFPLTVPWLITHSGTKTYMVGVMEQQKVKEGYYPCLLWRNSYEGVKVFCVCGDYMSTLAGLGILSSFVYEMNPYELYPVVNAQNVVINNFPNFSEENSEKLMKLYSRGPLMYFQGIMWPSISALSKTNFLHLTCLFKPEYDYQDNRKPQAAEVPFYLKQFKEVTAEAGVSLSHDETSSFEKMLREDKEFFKSLNSRYQYQVTFATETDMEHVRDALATEQFLYHPVTVGAYYNKGDILLSYLTDDTTLQRITGTAEQHTFYENFTLRSIRTALLYSNVLVDLQDAVWPKNEDDQWQLLFEEVASNIHTYWSGISGLEQTTLSESDYRVRKFLNMNYSHERYGNHIVLKVQYSSGETWFLLRTHDEKITAIRGGEYEKLESNLYLITASDSMVEIELEPLSLKELEEE